MRVVIYILIYVFLSAGFLAIKIYFKLDEGQSYNMNKFLADIPGALIMAIGPVLIPIVYFSYLSRKNANKELIARH